MDCIFCKIIAGEISSLKIYEDEKVLSFLDIGPVADGHLLIVPKKHYERLDQMSSEDITAVASVLPRLADALVRATGAEGYNLLQNTGSCAGQVVPHVHFHLIPGVSGDGLGYRWPAKKYPEGKDKEMQQKILSELK